MILVDVGNTRAHVWMDGAIEHMSIDAAIRRYHAQRVYYINVNPHHTDALSALASWHDLSDALHLIGEYDSMGVDRKAACLSRPEGIFVDAGSAITVDRVVSGVYQGGFILPGLRTCRRMFASISPLLDLPLDEEITLDILPKSTQGSVSFGVLTAIIAPIEQIRADLPLFITGGDGPIIARHCADAQYDAGLVFEGMRAALSDLNSV